MVDNWREKLDQNVLVGAVLADFSKAFGCIPHDMLITKLQFMNLIIALYCLDIFTLKSAISTFLT